MTDSLAGSDATAGQAPVAGTATTASAGAPPPDTSLPPDYVRNSPEYRALQQELRNTARAKGSLEAQLAESRQQAEAQRQAAEAAAQEARDREIRTVLGDEGVSMWAQMADLSQSDPVAAARLLAQWRQGAAPPPPATPPAQEPNVQQAALTGQTPPPPSGLDATAPLGSNSTGDEYEQAAAAMETEFGEIVERLQNPLTRNRVTLRDQARGFFDYLTASYLKAGARPKQR